MYSTLKSLAEADLNRYEWSDILYSAGVLHSFISFGCRDVPSYNLFLRMYLLRGSVICFYWLRGLSIMHNVMRFWTCVQALLHEQFSSISALAMVSLSFEIHAFMLLPPVGLVTWEDRVNTRVLIVSCWGSLTYHSRYGSSEICLCSPFSKALCF